MDNGSLSASDVAMLAGNNDGFGNGWGGMIWLFAILALMGGGFGGWGNNTAAALGYENLATSNEVQRGFDNQNSMANQREILAAVNSGTAQSVAASNQVYHDVVGYVGDKYNELARDIAGVAMAQQQCNGETQRMIAENKYENAMALAGLEMRLNSKLDGNQIQELQNQVNALQLQNQLNGVVRYPTNTYYAVPSPCFNGCSCGNI